MNISNSNNKYDNNKDWNFTIMYQKWTADTTL